jgi:DNA-binding transcriptional MerR regulator
MLDINEVSKAAGLPASAIRFYEEKGLIKSAGRKGLRRLFPDNILERLAVISLARDAGFSLAEIGMVVRQNSGIDRSLLLAKADELERTMKKMAVMRKGLLHAAACTAPNHFECPKFKRLLRLSGKKSSRPRGRKLKRS